MIAEIVVAAPAGRLTVSGAGRSVGISAGSWHAYSDFATFLQRRSRSERRQLLSRLRRVLRDAGLELSFQIDGREIARATGAGTGWMARGLALPGVKIRVGRLLAALLRSHIETRATA